MSLDGFLTFIGLMIATYAILSPISRLRLRLNTYRQLVLGLVAATLVGFLQFYYELRSIAPDALSPLFMFEDFGEQTSGFSNERAAFLVVVAWLLLALLLHANAKPRAIGLGALKTLTERLHDEGRYLELVELVGPYLVTIRRAVEKKLFGQRLHHCILDTHLRATNPFFYSRMTIEYSFQSGWRNGSNLLRPLFLQGAKPIITLWKSKILFSTPTAFGNSWCPPVSA